jgi:hypothetical protein
LHVCCIVAAGRDGAWREQAIWSLIGDWIWRIAVSATCDILWHFVKRWSPFLRDQQLIRISSSKNQDSCIS